MDQETIPKEQYLRLAADFDNYRKRTDQEASTMIRFGNEKILLEIADVLDVIERSGTDQYDMKKLLEQIIQKQGMTRIETQGKVFDPMTMEAVSMSDGVPSTSSGQVKEEVRAGYTMHDRVIRPARVIIYN